MILTWLDKRETPNFRQKDRLIGILFDLGIASREQIMTITGWSRNQVTGTINKIRQAVPEKERDGWIRFWAPERSRKFVYSLGEKGIAHACAMIQQEIGRRKPLEGQIAHALGLNDILCRLMQEGASPRLWYSTKEASSFIFHHLTEREVVYDDEDEIIDLKMKKPKFQIHPDAIVVMKEIIYFIEYDTGTENGHKIEAKMHKYGRLKAKIGEIGPLIWITPTERRRDFLYNVWKKLVEDQEHLFPEMHIFSAGEETAFLQGDKEVSKTKNALDQFERAQQTASEYKRKNDQLERELAEAKRKIERLERDYESETRSRQRSEKETSEWRGKYRSLKSDQEEVVDWFRAFEDHFQESEVGKPTKVFRWGFQQAYQGYIKRNPLPKCLEAGKRKEESVSGDPLSWG